MLFRSARRGLATLLPSPPPSAAPLPPAPLPGTARQLPSQSPPPPRPPSLPDEAQTPERTALAPATPQPAPAATSPAGRTAEDGGSPADVTGPGQPCAATGRATRHRNEPSVDADGEGHPPLAQPELDDADPLPPRRAPVPQRGAPARRGPAARNPARQARRAPGRPRCETAPRAPAPAPEWDRDDNDEDLGLNALGTAFPDPGPEGVADAPAGRPGPPAPQLSPA